MDPMDLDKDLTDEQRQQKVIERRKARRTEILGMIQARGKPTDEQEQTDLVKAIEKYEYADGDKELGGKRRMTIGPLMSSGHHDLANVIEVAERQLKALDNFDD